MIFQAPKAPKPISAGAQPLGELMKLPQTFQSAGEGNFLASPLA